MIALLEELFDSYSDETINKSGPLAPIQTQRMQLYIIPIIFKYIKFMNCIMKSYILCSKYLIIFKNMSHFIEKHNY
jgi:hypothetical protein